MHAVVVNLTITDSERPGSEQAAAGVPSGVVLDAIEVRAVVAHA